MKKYIITEEELTNLVDNIAKTIMTTVVKPELTEQKSTSKKRGNLKFSMIGIKPGDKIKFIPTNTEVVVISDDKISDGKEIYTMSGYTKQHIPESQKNACGAYQGGLYFSYKGKVLTEIRDSNTL